MPSLVDFETQLKERLQDPEYRAGFEKEYFKLNLQIMINDLLQDTGNEDLCVEVMDIDDYCN